MVVFFIVVQSILFLFVLATVYSFIPIPFNPANEGLPLKLLMSFRPEREVFLYRMWLGFIIIFSGLFIVTCWRRVREERFLMQLRQLMGVHLFLLGLCGYSFFKIILYQGPSWAYGMMYVAQGLFILSWIFAPELCKYVGMGAGFLKVELSLSMRWIIALVSGILVVVNMVPFHLGNFFILIKQVNGAYPLDEGNFRLLVVATVIFYGLYYLVVWKFFKNAWIASWVLILSIHLQMNHWGAYPFHWVNPVLNPIGFFVSLSQSPLPEMSVFTALKFRYFEAFLLGFIIPFFYAGALFYFCQKLSRGYTLKIVLCLAALAAGLLLQGVFFYHGHPFSYLTWSSILVFIVAVVQDEYVMRYCPQLRNSWACCCWVLTVFLVLTNHVFITTVNNYMRALHG